MNTTPITEPELELLLQKLKSSDNLQLIEGLYDEMMNRQKYLQMHPYKVYFSETEQRWRTELPDPTKKSGRRAIKRKSKEDIENLIIDHYKNQKNNSLRFSSLYMDWLLNYKSLEISEASLERMHSAYMRYYDNTKLANTDVTKITPIMLKEFLLKHIKDYDMNYKAYTNMATIPRQLFDYCVEKEYIEFNPMERVKIKRNVFRHEKKPESHTQVYFDDELEKLEDAVLKDFETKPTTRTTGLAILLAHQTGLRVGELVTLKPSDIKGSYLTVERTETSYSIINPDGTKSKPIYEIKDFPKTDDSNRDIPLTDKSLKYISMILEANAKHGFLDSEYLFINSRGKRITRKSIDRAIRTFCKLAELDPRSSHKFRKTFISTLYDTDGISKDELRRIAGHSDLTVTTACYVFNRNPKETTLSALNKAL